MSGARRSWLAGAVLVTLGWLLSPTPVPVYDGVGVPDEPYRFVVPPAGTAPTAPPTSGQAVTPVAHGAGTNGLIIATAEQSPQFSLFLPPGAMAARGGTITVKAVPVAATGTAVGATIAGNAYRVTMTDPAGPVTLTAKAAIASLYLRAVAGTQEWVMEYRPKQGEPWQAKQTSRGGTDSFVASFAGAGEYALATAVTPKAKGGVKPLPLVLAGAILLLLVVVGVIRLRAAPE